MLLCCNLDIDAVLRWLFCGVSLLIFIASFFLRVWWCCQAPIWDVPYYWSAEGLKAFSVPEVDNSGAVWETIGGTGHFGGHSLLCEANAAGQLCPNRVVFIRLCVCDEWGQKSDVSLWWKGMRGRHWKSLVCWWERPVSLLNVHSASGTWMAE